jgi:HSP20 family molecular chaperone IbpA
MIGNSQRGNVQAVQVVEADILDKMNETNSLIAQRAYEIFESRGGAHGSDPDDWFTAEGEVLHPLAIERTETESALRITAQVPGFEAKDLEVVLGHGRAVICGVHAASDKPADSSSKLTKVMRIVELPFKIDPGLASATLEKGTLLVVLPRLQ